MVADKVPASHPGRVANIGLFQTLSYAFPSAAIIFLYAPLNILQGVYAKYYGLALTSLALVIFLSRMFDAVTDPVVGYYSDRYRDKRGSRKPIIFFGALLVVVSGFCLYSPSPDQVTLLYFTFWSFVFYLGFTLFDVNHAALASDLARDTDVKTTVFSFRAIMGYFGLVLFYAIPLLPFFESSEITPETFQFCAQVAVPFVLISMIMCLKVVKESDDSLWSAATVDRAVNNNFVVNTLSVLKNKPFLIYLAAFTFSGLGMGMWMGLIFIYVDVYLLMGDAFSKIFLMAFVVGIAVAPVWVWLSKLLGKKYTWALANGLILASFVFTAFLDPAKVTFEYLVALKVINTAGFVCLNIISPSVLSDIADYGLLKHGLNQSGLYFSVNTFLQKFVFAVGGALGLAIAGWFEFDAMSDSQTLVAVFGVHLAIAWIPAFSVGVSLIAVLFLPISHHKHKIIVRRLEGKYEVICAK